MQKVIKITTLISLWLSHASCNQSPQIDFHSYQELSEYSYISNGWIPEILGSDVYGIQETYDIYNSHLYGKFDFTNRQRYDSIISTYPTIEPDSIIARINAIKRPQSPNWFIEIDYLSATKQKMVKHENFYLILEMSQNRIYFVR